MEGMVEYGMDVSKLKYAVSSATLNGETALAQKYNDVLKSTLFHKSWAMKQQACIDHPEDLKKAPEFGNILAIIANNDVLDGDHSLLENFLRNYFANIEGGHPVLVELSVLFNLDLKNIPGFWPSLFSWVKTHEGQHIPVHFQEAALLYEHLEHKGYLEGAPFDNEVIVNFQHFLALTQQYVNYPEEAVKDMYYTQFGHTFWYYYFFVKEQPGKKKSLTQSPYSS
jgi:hypothetical protein